MTRQVEVPGVLLRCSGRFVRDTTGSLGALVTILALGIDPFSQAVISFYGCSINDTVGVPSISRLNSFDTERALESGESFSISPWITINGGFGDPTIVTPNFTCPTESCRFTQPYHSLGVCSRCSDVSHLLITKCNSSSPTILNDRDDVGLSRCSYTLESSAYGRTTAGFDGLDNSNTFASFPGIAEEGPDALLSINKYYSPLTQEGNRDVLRRYIQEFNFRHSLVVFSLGISLLALSLY